MKMTCYGCVANLIILGICAGIYAFTGFDLIKFLSFGSDVVYRSFFAICFVSALFTIYSLIVFKPYKGLK
ncbi:MAG: hypothetical protein K2L42_02370 [Clostridia bacterium]|nr:hypothetical protein [Clostridia bacterium]